MTQQPLKSPAVTASPNLVWMVGLLAVAAAAGLLGNRFFNKPAPATPETKLEHAVEAFRSGYDQTALSTLTPLAAEGNPKAQYWLADIYENGLGVTPDATKAVALLGKSAAQGFVPAEKHLGELYLQGNETLQDFGAAQTWLRKAAIAGNSAAQRELGHIYALGLGVPSDPSMAYGWYENAALNGDGLAKGMRDDILTRMEPPAVAKGQQDAKDIGGEIKPAKSEIKPPKL